MDGKMAKNGARSIIKKVASVGAVGVGAIPAVMPVVKTAQSFTAGQPVETAVNAGLGVMGLNTSGTINWSQATKYGLFAAGCYGGMIGLRMLAKRL